MRSLLRRLTLRCRCGGSRSLRALTAAVVVLNLLHSPSMTVAALAQQGHLHFASHAHHAQHGQADHNGGQAPAAGHDGGAVNSIPNCPMSNLAAIDPAPAAAGPALRAGDMASANDAPLAAVDSEALDPPPRRIS